MYFFRLLNLYLGTSVAVNIFINVQAQHFSIMFSLAQWYSAGLPIQRSLVQILLGTFWSSFSWKSSAFIFEMGSSELDPSIIKISEWRPIKYSFKVTKLCCLHSLHIEVYESVFIWNLTWFFLDPISTDFLIFHPRKIWLSSNFKCWSIICSKIGNRTMI